MKIWLLNKKQRQHSEHLIDLTDDADVKDALKFLWAREIIHYQRFGEALNDVYDHLNSKRVFNF
jgi:spore coat protein JC